MQIAQIWDNLLTLQSHVQQQSLLQEPSWTAPSSGGSLNFRAEHLHASSQNNRRCRPNRKGLKERLRQKRRSQIVQESDSEDHKVWHSSDESAQADRSRALVVSSEITLLASMQEKLFEYIDQLRTREAGLAERELKVRETELVENLHAEKVRADRAVARADEAKSQTQAAQIRLSHLEMALQSEAVRAQQAEQQVLELQEKLFDTENSRSALVARRDELEEKLRDAQIESCSLSAHMEKLTAKLRDTEIETGTLSARNKRLEGKLREAEIESGSLTARNKRLEEKLRNTEIESGSLTARNLQLQEGVAQLEACFQPEWSYTDH
jgi:chromosome segregation ATPase